MSSDLRHIGRLARIELTDEQAAAFGRQLADIVGYFDKLNELDTDGVEPMASAVALGLPMREDVVTEGGDAGPVLANAPGARSGFFVVPKVVE